MAFGGGKRRPPEALTSSLVPAGGRGLPHLGEFGSFFITASGSRRNQFNTEQLSLAGPVQQFSLRPVTRSRLLVRAL
jgi:hypothetical protein